MKVFVVMGNDYPDAVFTSNEAAEAYCCAKRSDDVLAQPKGGMMHGSVPRIYWRVYAFDLREKV